MGADRWGETPSCGLVFYSSASGNTARFVARLALPAQRIPIRPTDAMPLVDAPFVLICPTYADGQGRGAVPKQVIHFLNDSRRRTHLRGVIGAGNRNFGATFALAARVIADKCNVPLLWRFELAGTETDIQKVRTGLHQFRGMECLTV
jgi:protein involved in ribonucleotide reduction